MSHRASFLLGALLIGVSLLSAPSAVEALAVPIGKGDLVVTTSDGTQVKSEDKVVMTLPADTSLVAADVQDDWVLVHVRKDGKEVTGFVQAASVRRVAMAKHTDPQGFSLQYPESWKVDSAEDRAVAAEKVKEYLVKPHSLGGLPMSWAVANPGHGDHHQNVIATIAPSLVGEIDDATAKLYFRVLGEYLQKVGMPTANAHAEVIKVAKTKAISCKWDVTLKDLGGPVRQWMVAVPGKSRSYTFTCSALASEFWQYEPLFAAVIQSIEVDVAGAKP